MIGEGNHPDLGVYLQPDPEHLVGARIFSGPQAYAYAGGRPLVNADPTGRIIEGFGETATLRNLPDGYGALVRYIDDDQRFVVKVISASSTDSDVVAHHGACTVNWGTEERRPGGSWCGASQTVDTVEVKYNVALAQNEYNQRANAWGVALGATPLYLVAHELGHVYYQQYLVGSNPYSASASADLAIRFENAARRPGAQRPLGTE